MIYRNNSKIKVMSSKQMNNESKRKKNKEQNHKEKLN